MKCSLGRALANSTRNQREIAEMLLDDREGYDPALLHLSLFDLLKPGSLEAQVVVDHRNGDCCCPS